MKCTLHSNHRLTVWYSNTTHDFSPGAAIFSLHTLASPSGRNVNYDEKQVTGGGWRGNLSCSFYLYRFRKYMSYGFPIIYLRNPGVHYETALYTHIYQEKCKIFPSCGDTRLFRNVSIHLPDYTMIQSECVTLKEISYFHYSQLGN